MTEEVKLRDVDHEIERLHDAYDALKALDRPAQMRALWWLGERLQADEMLAEGKGASRE